MLPMPSVDRFGRSVHSPIFMVSADMMPPRVQAAGNAVQHPQPRFVRGLARKPESRFPGLIHRHALRNQLAPAQQRVDQFSSFAVVLKPAFITTCLMVEHYDLGAFGDCFIVAEILTLGTDAAAHHPRPNAIRTASGLRSGVIQIPKFQTSIIVPTDPLAEDRVVPVLRRRNLFSAALPELALAVFAMAEARTSQPAPAVVGETLGPVTLCDLAKDGWDVVFVIRTVDAGNKQLTGLARLPVCIHSKPVRVSPVTFFLGSV